jgi:N-acetylmuramoyl-L-alanine amidase
MLRKIFFTPSLVIAIIILSSYKIFSGAYQFQKNSLHTIIIDAGHGYPDGGAEGKYSKESDITLAIALKLGKELQDSLPYCQILYTRTDKNLPNGLTDHNAANRWRAEFANENHGDLFLCIHCNDAPPVHHSEFIGYETQTYHSHGKKHTRQVKQYNYYTTPSPVQGTETYVWAVGKNDSKINFVNANADDSSYGEQVDSSYHYFDSPEAKIIASLKTKKYFNRSILLASNIEDEYIKQGRSSRGVKQRDDEGIWVLQATAMPSILTETGFITNPDEENYLNSDNGQNEVSDAITKAVMRYKAYLENLQGNGSQH